MNINKPSYIESKELQKQFIKALMKNKVSNVADIIYKIISKNSPMNIDQKIQQVDKLKSWLDSFRPLPYEVVAELKKYYDVNFTYNSNAIEGNTLTQSETEMVLEKGVTVGGKTLNEHLEVIGHKEAIDYIEDLARKETRITEREIKDIHHIILQGIDRASAGSYRNLDVRASGTNHVYPPHYLVNDLMQEFIKWMESEEAQDLHPLKLATEVHYRFVSIHPFKDGNGRTARLLMNLALLRNGYPISIITNDLRSEYIEALVYAQDNSDDVEKLAELVADSCKHSLVEHLRIVSTFPGMEDKGKEFFSEMKEYLDSIG